MSTNFFGSLVGRAAAQDDEQTPLLQRVDKLKARAPSTVDGSRLWAQAFYTTNVPWCVVTVNFFTWTLHVFTVYGSYLFLQYNWKMFTPKCYEYERQSSLSVACNAAGICFWTFPLLCAIVVIITFWRHLYEKRLYYECLLHRMLLNYSNSGAIQSPIAWVFIGYGIVGMSNAFFVADDPVKALINGMPLTRALMIYAAPLVSFFMVFLSVWQVENHLLPIPKFYENDPDLAQEVMKDAVYAPYKHLHVAFEEVQEALDERNYDEPLTSAEYLGLLAEAVRIEVVRAKKASYKDNPDDDGITEICGVKVMQEYAERYPVSRPEVLSWSYSFGKGGWWVHRLLHSRHFSDDRATSFRNWAWLSNVISVFVILCFSEMYTTTIVDWFKTQQKMAQGLI